jgi:glycosyltransferase involved in cell wall biosynthesis
MGIIYTLLVISMGDKSNKIKVLYTIPNFDTAGSGKALLKVAQRLDRDRFEPEICCMHDRGAFFKEVQSSGIPVHLFPYTAEMGNRLNGLRQVWRISRFFKSLRPDIIHSFHYAPDYSEPLAARLAGIKWVYTKKNMSWGGSSKNGWRLRSCLADGIIAQNTDMIKDFFGGWKNVVLISRGVDEVEFHPGPPPDAVNNALDLSSDNRLIVCVANLVPVKGVEVLLDAFSAIIQYYPQSRLAIIGDDCSEYAKMLKVKALEIGSGQIYFIGKVLNVVDYLRAADIFVLPTLNKGRQEGSPVSLLEAMACGKVVLASNVAGIRDQLNEVSDLLFEPGNSKELAEKICTILNLSKQEIDSLGKRLITTVHEKLSLNREVRAHESFYIDINKK